MSPHQHERDRNGGRRGGCGRGGHGGSRGGHNYNQRRNNANGPSPRDECRNQPQGNSNATGRRGIMKNTQAAPFGFDTVPTAVPIPARNLFFTGLNDHAPSTVQPRAARSSVVTCITALSTKLGGAGCYRCTRTNRKLRDFLIDLFEGGRLAVDEWAEAAGVSFEDHMEWERTKTRTLAGGLRRGSEPCNWCCAGMTQGVSIGGVGGGGGGGPKAAHSVILPPCDRVGVSSPEQQAAVAARAHWAGYAGLMPQDPWHAYQQQLHTDAFRAVEAQQNRLGAPLSTSSSAEDDPAIPRMAPRSSGNRFLAALPTNPGEMAIQSVLNPLATSGPVHGVTAASVDMSGPATYRAVVPAADVAQAQQVQWPQMLQQRLQRQQSSQYDPPD